jgi:cysteinyl-tRNA synthetase
MSAGSTLKMFVCGPTVYDYVHLGHARTYLAFDMIVRYLEYSGFKVDYLMNITDVAEKVAQRAKQLHKEPLEVAHEFEVAFLEDIRALGIRKIDALERASDHMPEILAQVGALISKGVAYETETGVYFEVRKFPRFGELSQQGPEELGLKRLELCSTKRHPEDFSVWRKHDGGWGYDSPWGFGRPGWHVEDTTISMARFGDTYDIHGGASELIFPHHEAEIAQAEALTGKAPFVRLWLHTGLLSVNGKKMSKSLGNVIRIRDALKDYSAQELRYYFASVHYREPVVISAAKLTRAKGKANSLARAVEVFSTTKPNLGGSDNAKLEALIRRAESDFRRCMDDDFDTPGALKVLVNLSKGLASLARRGFRVDEGAKADAESRLRNMAGVLGVLPQP